MLRLCWRPSTAPDYGALTPCHFGSTIEDSMNTFLKTAVAIAFAAAAGIAGAQTTAPGKGDATKATPATPATPSQPAKGDAAKMPGAAPAVPASPGGAAMSPTPSEATGAAADAKAGKTKKTRKAKRTKRSKAKQDDAATTTTK
jgi:hypothetical protein